MTAKPASPTAESTARFVTDKVRVLGMMYVGWSQVEISGLSAPEKSAAMMICYLLMIAGWHEVSHRGVTRMWRKLRYRPSTVTKRSDSRMAALRDAARQVG